MSLAWLTARPIAHRGFHDAAAGRIENTLSAIGTAADRGFSVEIDVHLSADGEVVVFHDFTLDRLTEGHGPIAALTRAALAALPFKSTADRIPALTDVLDRIDGRVGLVIEVKSDFRAAPDALVAAVARTLASYGGPVAVMSFDPRVLEAFVRIAPTLPRGIVADAADDPHEYGDLSAGARAELAALGHRGRTRPDFVSYWVKLLPNALSRRVREEWRLPLITWTVRSADDRVVAAAHADQITFEGFDPDA